MSLADGILRGVYTQNVGTRRATDTAYLTNTAASLLAASSTTGAILITSVTLCNTHTSALTVDLYRQVDGDTAGASDAQLILDALSVAAHETIIITFEDGMLLADEGDFLAGAASTTNKVTITINYIIENA